MQLTTTHSIGDEELEILGLVKGLAPTSTHSFNTALKYMTQEAQKLKADAVIGIQCSSLCTSSTEFQTLLYGTAVKFKISTDLQQF